MKIAEFGSDLLIFIAAKNSCRLSSGGGQNGGLPNPMTSGWWMATGLSLRPRASSKRPQLELPRRIPRDDVRFTLIHPRVRQLHALDENIRDLHRWVDQLGKVNTLPFLPGREW